MPSPCPADLRVALETRKTADTKECASPRSRSSHACNEVAERGFPRSNDDTVTSRLMTQELLNAREHARASLKVSSSFTFTVFPSSQQHQPQQHSETPTQPTLTQQTPTTTSSKMDSGRKDAGDKLQDKFTPENSKSTTDKIKEGVTDAGDKIQR